MNPDNQNPLEDSKKPLEPSEVSPGSSPNYPVPPALESPKESSSQSTFQEKEDVKKNEAESKKAEETKESENVMNYFLSHREAVITYILLALGILLLTFDAFLLGSLIVGLVAGYHFSHEIVFYLRNLTQIFAGQEQVRYIVLTAVIIALFIAIPGIFIGAIVAAVFKQVIAGNGGV